LMNIDFNGFFVTPSGVDIDIAWGVSPFEESVVSRSSTVHLGYSVEAVSTRSR
jgi:hypothetical protein